MSKRQSWRGERGSGDSGTLVLVVVVAALFGAVTFIQGWIKETKDARHAPADPKPRQRSQDKGIWD